jgi:signal transduction histidine kinase
MALVGAAAAAVAGGDVALILARQAAAGSSPSGRDAIWLVAFAAFCAAMVVGLRSRAGERRGSLAVVVESLSVIAMATAVSCYSAAFLFAWVAWHAGWSLSRSRAAALVAGQAVAFAVLGAVFAVRPLDGAEVAMQVVMQGLALGAALAVRREAAAHRAALGLLGDLERAERRLAEQAIAAERGRVSRDLHDVLGHRLVALGLQLEIAERAARSAGTAAPAALVDSLGRARGLSRELLGDVRGVVRAFRAPPDDLRGAIEGLVAGFSHPVARISIDDGAAAALGPTAAHTLVRCVQELVTNVLKHAGASHLDVEVRRRDGLAEAVVRDDGAGGALPGSDADGTGLIGVRERLSLLGGELLLGKGDGGGWCATVRIPLVAGEAAA